MATLDVPGYNPANNDKLARGSWAEHDDGSLIYVKDIDENSTVIFELFELSDKEKPIYYSHALSLKDFEETFSYNPKKNDISDIKWTWHNRTPFDWQVVMKYISRPLPAMVNVQDQISAAQRVAESLKMRMSKVLTEDHVLSEQGYRVNRGGNVSKTIFQRIKNAVGELVN